MDSKLTMLMILDGFGENNHKDGNAVKLANTPNIDKLMKKYPTTKIAASGLAVGLPEGQMGNSEVGHTNMGAGRIVYQELTRITKTINDSLMIGDIKCSALQKDHGNWMICNGRALSREDYADLFEAIGETFGDGNGITTFNLPDCRGVAVRGYDNGRGYDSGRKFGSYQADQMQTHTHGVPGVQSFCSGGGRNIGVYYASDASASADFKTSSNASGRTGSETRMKNIALNYFIKVKED